MIGPGTGVRVYLACGVTDMRKGIAGLSALAQDGLRQDPASGAVFAFRSQERRPSEAALLGWPGLLPLLQGAGARAFPMAERQGRRDTADQRTARHALGGHGLAPSDLGRASRTGRVTSAQTPSEPVVLLALRIAVW